MIWMLGIDIVAVMDFGHLFDYIYLLIVASFTKSYFFGMLSQILTFTLLFLVPYTHFLQLTENETYSQ